VSKLLLTVMLALALAGPAGATTSAPPKSPAEGPDLTVMALALADFPGAKLDGQKYIPVSSGTVASYERDLVLASGAIGYISDEVDLYSTVAKAQNDSAGLKALLSSAAGRKALGREFARGLKPLKTKSIAVSRATSVPAGELAYRFTITAVTNKGTVRVGFVVLRVHRAVAFLFVLARKGARIPATSLVSLAKTQEAHFQGGFTIASVTAPTIAGTAAQGQTLTADRGHWSGGPEQFTYQWKRCDALGANCADIAGATAATYAVTPADAGFTLGVRAQATNPLSTLTAESALTAVVTQ
jgi:hypothetical protein